MRYPHCYFEITDPDGQDGQVLEVRCGNKNRLRVADLVPVPAGGKFDPYARGLEGGLYRFSDETFRKPGRYRLRFVYSTDGTNWDGDLGEKPTQEEALEIARRLKLVPKVTIKSNDLVIESLAGNPGK
ncbi:MAG TPA: hypothetical protein PK280_20350 [Planctomycetota bacterium]|nr:hypothetical protein [Planctomycetota bacterium]